LDDQKNLKGVQITVCPELSSQEVVETYDYVTQGIVHVDIENRTSGYRRHFRLTPGNS